MTHERAESRAPLTATERGNPSRRIVSIARAGASLLAESAKRWVDDSCFRLAASLAYYALFSIFPLLLLSVTILGFFLGSGAPTRDRLLSTVANASSPAYRSLLEDTLKGMQAHLTARGVGAVVGLVSLIFGASAVCSELQSALNIIWRVKDPPSRGVLSSALSLIRGKLISFAIVGAGAFVVLASLALGTAEGAIGESARKGSVAALLSLPVELLLSVGFLAALLAALFRTLPQTHVAWKDVVGGALLTALLFAGLKKALAWYLAHLASYAAYGVVGAVLGLLTWIYLTSLFLFFGAEVTRVYAERFGSLAKDEAKMPA